MKKILVSGKNSYVGTSFKEWVSEYPEEYSVDEIDLKNTEWEKKNFSQYDTVFHVAGIAHVSTDPKMEDLYYQVNRDLTYDVAQKAKNDGVSQFVFMSSMIVYGDNRPELKDINESTIPKPSNFYGESKLQAEERLKLLEDDSFHIAILRPPMIYGSGSKGNYPKLSKIACILPIFPDINNKRSMLHIENLCEFVRLIIKNNDKGIFFPQNREYSKTSELVKQIAEANGKNIILTKWFNIFIKPFISKVNILNKVFGDLAYNQSISKYKEEYRINSLKQSIIKTEKKN